MLKFGFARTAMQAVCAVLVLCLAVGLLRQDGAQSVFSAQEEGVRLPILMYHSILKDSARQGNYVVSPDVLAADLDALQQRGYETVTVTDLLAYVQDGEPLPEKPVMITFDDGYYNNYVYAYPLLQQRGMRAVLSIIGSQTALYTAEGTENAYWSHLRLDRLREMQDVFEVQNHSWNLHEYGERRGCLRRSGETEESYESLLREDTAETACLRRSAIPIRLARARRRASAFCRTWVLPVRSAARSASTSSRGMRGACMKWDDLTGRRGRAHKAISAAHWESERVEGMRFSELHCREVINLCDGARLGEVSDLVFDPVCGQITAIVVPGQGGLLGMFSREDCVIPWSCIETLGEDYILVKFHR